jgi:hypothetical protein
VFGPGVLCASARLSVHFTPCDSETAQPTVHVGYAFAVVDACSWDDRVPHGARMRILRTEQRACLGARRVDTLSPFTASTVAHVDLAFRSQSEHAHVLDDYYPTTIDIDGRGIRLRITRFDMEQHADYMRGFQRVQRITKRDELRLDRARQQKRDPLGEPIFLDVPAAGDVPAKRLPLMEDDGEVLARLDLDETDEQRTAREQRDETDEKFARGFVIDSITKYVSVEPRQLATADAPITTGAQLLRYFASREDVLQTLLARIYIENVLTDEQKKRVASQRASAHGSTPSTPTANGEAPAPTADAASNSISAVDAAAPSQPTSSSGPTDLSS